jgi:hypothetical protein
VDLDRAFGQVQPGGDLTVGPPGGELGENGSFPVGELAEHRVVWRSTGRGQPGTVFVRCAAADPSAQHLTVAGIAVGRRQS